MAIIITETKTGFYITGATPAPHLKKRGAVFVGYYNREIPVRHVHLRRHKMQNCLQRHSRLHRTIQLQYPTLSEHGNVAMAASSHTMHMTPAYKLVHHVKASVNTRQKEHCLCRKHN
ncbi:hypothetical protein KC19_VG114000 [Ceratodon purpureus]|uniref:Uncharacterized protein n=1 Tax=Ceratodon purpureus TaxID=3225 RepID=A0A8T0HP48_CERPU|nr:hypothetical protein KC19_VG114000 [Ceratodon purpureus]